MDFLQQLERVRKSAYINTDLACRFVLEELRAQAQQARKS